MVKIVCTNCQKALSLDETKVGSEGVTFPCPACKTKLTYRRPDAAAAAPAHDPQHEGHGDDEDGFGSKALIVGNDSPALRQATKLIGFMPVYMQTPQQA